MIGRTISHYRVLEKLGEGGMGVVFKAEDIRLHRTVALKFLPPGIAQDPEIKGRFFQEARTASTLDHPNIATIYEIEEADGEWFIAMAYVEGINLKGKIQDGPMPIEEALNLAIQIAQGLTAAHAKEIIHRDIKPANIIIAPSGQAKITDFGLAKYKDSSLVTKEGAVMGTPAYMSPEQARGEEVDHRSDIFSLGIVLYEMLSGQIPFQGDSDLAILYSIVHQKPRPIRKTAPRVPAGIEQIISKALEKGKMKRYQQMSELLTDLKIAIEELRDPKKKLPLKIVDKESRRRRRRRIVIPVCLIALLMVVVLFLRPLLLDQALISEPTPIAVISFENRTGNNAYDYLQQTIPNLLITSLEQSKYLRVTTWERLYDLLRQLEKEEVEIIDKDLGYELCRVDGTPAIVLGSIERAGDTFTVDVNIFNVETERLLHNISVHWEGDPDLSNIPIDRLSREISHGIGISDRRIARTYRPIREVTTNSMEAYNYFIRGRREYERFYDDDARRFLEKAVQLDSTFAAAYLYLGSVYRHLGNISAMKEAYEKAKAFAGKATDKEKLYIEARYARTIARDMEKTFSILQRMTKEYPKEKRAFYSLAIYHMSMRQYPQAIEQFDKVLQLDPDYGLAINNLAYAYVHTGVYHRAIELFKRYASVSPGDANPFDSMAETYLKMGLLDESIARYKEALEVKPDFGIEWKIAYLCALREEYVEAADVIDRWDPVAQASGKGAECLMWKGFYHFWLGRMREALSDFGRALTLSETEEKEWVKDFSTWMKGWIYFNGGELELAKQCFQDWLDFVIENPSPYVVSSSISFYTVQSNFALGLTDLKNGQIDSAEAKCDEMRRALPEVDAYVKEQATVYFDVLSAEILLARGRAHEAVALFHELPQWKIPPMFSQYILPYNIPYFRDIRARGHLSNNERDEAISEYEHLMVLDPAGKDRQLIHPTYHYRLATLYEDEGWREKAIEQYEVFLDIWKDADEDLPDLIDAKIRLARLLEEK
jgi:serine/threonine protein kinase/predicted Zn-dependent protease